MIGVTGIDFSQQNLTELYNRLPVRYLGPRDRYVIFSDLHMGNGSRTDDFATNGDLFTQVLREYYAERSFHLILNGDVEDLQRFPMRAIVHRWPHVYEAFARVAHAGGLTRIVGNHDIDLLEGGPSVGPIAMHGHERWPETFIHPVLEGMRLQHECGEILLFHGHQTSRWYERHNDLIRLILRYIANPLRIGNVTVAANSRKRFRIEERVYAFASSQKVLAVIGHTHRPLFESMSKSDSIQFEIERLCRKYPKSKNKASIAEKIAGLKEELVEVRIEAQRQPDLQASLYREHLLVPSLFNSGCVLGKRGMTCLEIENNEMRLVYWYDTQRKQKFSQFRVSHGEEIEGTSFRRSVIKSDSLDYIFSRIHLLA